MKATVVTRFGGPEVLEPYEMPVPHPGPGQVLIKVAYAGVNYVDLAARQGYFLAGSLPFIPGYEVSGTIHALGEGVAGLHVGQPVASLTVQNGYAEFVAAKASLTFPLDTVGRQVGFEQAAAFPAVALTAHDLLKRAARMAAGESVLIHAASGGVGIAAGQIARALGARLVLGTAGSREKAAYARSFGYDEVFLTEEFQQSVMQATDGKGVDIVLDARGEPTQSQDLAVLALFGRLVVFGNSSGLPEKPVSPAELFRSNKAVIGYNITMLTQTAPHLVAETAGQVLRLLGQGTLNIPVSELFPLEQAAEAHRRIEARTHMGKLLLGVRERRLSS